jgi:hypothetical protein
MTLMRMPCMIAAQRRISHALNVQLPVKGNENERDDT